MIKTEIISYVKGFLPREDATQRYHSAWVERVIERVLIEMYSDLYKYNPHLLDNYTKTFGAVTPIAISLEATSGIYYSTLPVNIVNIACKGSGVRHIYPVQQTGNQFQPMDAREADMVFNTDVAIVTNKIGYRVRQDSRVDYYNMSSVIVTSGVRMDLLVPFSVYTDTEVVLIPDLNEKQGGTFINRVLPILGVVPPANLDDSNNQENNSQQNTKQ
jgi:hypothetical protein